MSDLGRLLQELADNVKAKPFTREVFDATDQRAYMLGQFTVEFSTRKCSSCDDDHPAVLVRHPQLAGKQSDGVNVGVRDGETYLILLAELEAQHFMLNRLQYLLQTPLTFNTGDSFTTLILQPSAKNYSVCVAVKPAFTLPDPVRFNQKFRKRDDDQILQIPRIDVKFVAHVGAQFGMELLSGDILSTNKAESRVFIISPKAFNADQAALTELYTDLNATLLSLLAESRQQIAFLRSKTIDRTNDATFPITALSSRFSERDRDLFDAKIHAAVQIGIPAMELDVYEWGLPESSHVYAFSYRGEPGLMRIKTTNGDGFNHEKWLPWGGEAPPEASKR